MHISNQELEVKFLVPGMESVKHRIETLECSCIQERTHEVNLRFDTPDHALTKDQRVLRLRQDTAARLTYKSPGQIMDGIQQRQELEVSVSSFSTAKALLEALGFQVVWMYEKYRQVFSLGDVLITLDETPIGDFIEIEGPDGHAIRFAVEQLRMDWDRRFLGSYAVLFERVRQELNLSFNDLSFANFVGIHVPIEVMGIKPGC